ncbi:MAG: sodium:proton antiporter [Acidobacteriota bacterium]
MPVVRGDAANVVAAFRKRHERRRRLFPRAVLTGLAAGLIGVLFRHLLERAEELRTTGFAAARARGPLAIAVAIGLCAAAVGLATWLVRRWSPEAAGSGIPHLKAVLQRLRPLRAARLIPVKFASGLLAIGGGLALGREGPTLQMGGAAGRLVSRWLPSTPRERQVLIAAGAGAGLSAAFNAPLAGLVFVLEEVQRNFSPGIFSASFLASVTADVVARLALGQVAVFHTPHPATPPLAGLPFYLVLGLVAGVVGVLFNRCLLGGLATVDRVPARARVALAAGVGGLIAAIGIAVPGLLGGGASIVERALSGQGAVAALLGLVAARFALTVGSYSLGTAGGIFAPLLVIGSQLGLALGLLFQRLAPAAVPEPRAFAIVGMGAIFAATVRAPLTGIVLMLEMTEGYSLMLPLLAATFVGQWTADLAGDRPIYEALLGRELDRSVPSEAVPPESILHEVDVHPGAPFDGRRVADLGLPRGCLIIGVERRGDHLVATGETVLAAGDRLTVVISSDAGEALAALLAGTGES